MKRILSLIMCLFIVLGSLSAAGFAALAESGFAGMWSAVKAEAEGMTMNKAMLEMMGMLIELTLNEDGTGALAMGEESEAVSWTESGDTVTLSAMGDALTMELNEEGLLHGDFDGVILFF